jgi:hypothetical protein
MYWEYIPNFIYIYIYIYIETSFTQEFFKTIAVAIIVLFAQFCCMLCADVIQWYGEKEVQCNQKADQQLIDHRRLFVATYYLFFLIVHACSFCTENHVFKSFLSSCMLLDHTWWAPLIWGIYRCTWILFLITLATPKPQFFL